MAAENAPRDESQANVQTYYQNRRLPQPVLPNLPGLELLKGQAALVTGANSGIGRAIALARS